MGRIHFGAALFLVFGFSSQAAFSQTYYNPTCTLHISKRESRLSQPSVLAALEKKGYSIQLEDEDMAVIDRKPAIFGSNALILSLNVNTKSAPEWVRATGGPFCTLSMIDTRNTRAMMPQVFTPSNSCNAAELIRKVPVCVMSEDQALVQKQPKFKTVSFGGTYQGGSWLSHVYSWAFKWIGFKAYDEGNRIRWNGSFASGGRGNWVSENGGYGIIFRTR